MSRFYGSLCISNNVHINSATDRTSIKYHKIYKDSRESLNERLLQALYFMRNILDLSAIMALDNLKPNISWHSVAVWKLLVLNNFIKDQLTEKSCDLRLLLYKGQASRP